MKAVSQFRYPQRRPTSGNPQYRFSAGAVGVGKGCCTDLRGMSGPPREFRHTRRLYRHRPEGRPLCRLSCDSGYTHGRQYRSELFSLPSTVPVAPNRVRTDGENRDLRSDLRSGGVISPYCDATICQKPHSDQEQDPRGHRFSVDPIGRPHLQFGA